LRTVLEELQLIFSYFEPDMSTCLNCSSTFVGNYCNHCGQKVNTQRITMKSVLHDLPHSVFHVDKGILRNIAGIVRPKHTVVAYIVGKRVSYFNPMLLFLLSLGSIFLLQHWTNTLVNFEFDAELAGVHVNATELLNHGIKYVCFAMAFLFALPSKFVFRKETGFNYPEHVIAQVFILTYSNIIYLLLILISPAHFSGFPFNVEFVLLIFFFTAIVFHKGKWWFTLLKTFCSLILELILYILTIVLFFMLSSFLINMIH
jgi:hypothetical protein